MLGHEHDRGLQRIAVVHGFDGPQFEAAMKIFSKLADGSGNAAALGAINEKLDKLAVVLQQVKDAVAGIDTTTEKAIVKALETRATALEALTPLKE